MDAPITYHIATTDADYDTGKTLFAEYAGYIGIDLSFQGFEKELTILRQQYGPPTGGLLLAIAGHTAIGCAGIRQLEASIGELKRMYVKTGYRGQGVGRGILERSLELAVMLGYKKIRLDTLEDMKSAQGLYRTYGFAEIPAYRFNPLEGAVYMEKDLEADQGFTDSITA